MPTLEARIETDRASRYLVQFCKHAAAMGGGGHAALLRLHGSAHRGGARVHADWTPAHGVVDFDPWGRCTLTAADAVLVVRVEAGDEDGARRIRDIVAADLARFSRRQPLLVTWHRPDASDGTTGTTGTDTPAPPRTAAGAERDKPRWGRWQTVALAAAVLAVVALHLGVAGAAVADSRWTGLAANAVVAVIVLKVAVVVLVRLGLRRRRRAVSDRRP